MTVYVDKAAIPYRGMKMCHMVADTLDELHEMADKIGMNRGWFQNHRSHPHYDLNENKRALAIRHGAVEIDNRQLVAVLRKYRAGREQANGN